MLENALSAGYGLDLLEHEL